MIFQNKNDPDAQEGKEKKYRDLQNVKKIHRLEFQFLVPQLYGKFLQDIKTVDVFFILSFWK